MLFKLFEFTFKMVSMTSSFNITVLRDTCWLESSVWLFLASFSLSKRLGFGYMTVSECHVIRVKSVIAIISRVVWITIIKAKILISLILMLLSCKLALIIILIILLKLLRQICSALRLFLQSSSSLIKLVKLTLLMSSLILNLLSYLIRV